MPIYGFLYSFNSALLLEMVSAQQAEIIVWVNMVQCEDQVDQSLPTVQATVRDSVMMQRYRAIGYRLDCLLHS